MPLARLALDDQKQGYAHSDEAPEADGDDAFDPPELGGSFGRVLGRPIDAANSHTQSESDCDSSGNANCIWRLLPDLFFVDEHGRVNLGILTD